MKILSITAQKPDSTGSGVYLTELAKGFEKLGHEQAVIAGVTKEDIVQLPESVGFYPVYYKTDELPFPVCGMSDEMPYESTRYCDMTEEMTIQFRNTFGQKVKEVVEEFSPDVILCHHLYYLTALVRELCPDIKVYGISHGSDLRQIQKNPWQREYIKKNICKLNQIFALHQEQKETICRIHGCMENQVDVIGTGYNSNVFFISSEQNKKNKKQRYIFAGKLSEKKGVMSYLKSVSYIPNAKERMELLFAGGYGNEAEYQEIQRLAAECPCDVTFLGKLTQTELAKKMNESDVFVLPSFFEGLPLVIIEAMACGLRVVCTDLPGIQNWVNANIPDNGVVFVEPPKMQNADEPIPESLPAFEERLAKALLEVQEQKVPDQKQVKKISWDGLCDKLNRCFSLNR
uniref:glycosyltransferase family 4 protein n=1 Tax=Agathobacter sp. TaxID=2021311 RepID=UPI00405720ED